MSEREEVATEEFGASASAPEAAAASAPADDLGPDVEGAAAAKPEPSPDGAAAADDDDKKDNKGLYSTDKF